MTTGKNDIERDEEEVAADARRDEQRTEVRAIVAELEAVGSHAEVGSGFRTTADASAFNDQMHYLANRLRKAFGDPIPDDTPAAERDKGIFEQREAVEDGNDVLLSGADEDEFPCDEDEDEVVEPASFEGEGEEGIVEVGDSQHDPIELHGQPGAKHWVQPAGNVAVSDPEAVFEDGDGNQKNDVPNKAGSGPV